jgi:4-aminobutyrate aminotransferase/(S)-3-amino-2-methylpropionate transaminase
MDAAEPGTLGGTYGGNPVACAAALAAIEVMESMDLNTRAREIGQAVRTRFEALQRRCPAIGDVRGIGAMIGVEFVEDGDPARPAGRLVKEIQRAALERGVLMIAAGTHGNIIRILSPLVITDAELDEGLTILEEEILAAWNRHETANAALANR